jgi:sugar/nucleoside kinase (ribokinase family)
MKNYDSLILGHLSKDIIIAPGQKQTCAGGAVLYSAVAAKQIGANIIALTKLSSEDLFLLDVFAKYDVPVICRESKQTTSFRLIYKSEDRERRICETASIAEPFELEDIPKDIKVSLYYLGGLIKGDFSEELVQKLSKAGKIAIDVQGFLRVNENGTLVFRDWGKKREILPIVSFLKTDAAEAQILTGNTDCQKAAQILCSWGADEVMVTHSEGVTVCAEQQIYTFPFTSRNLSGRTGRGDTCFVSYCHWRKNHSPKESCLFAAALTSLKMETPGPFSGSLKDVENAIEQRYGKLAD